jgi:hypothetical protein
VQSVSRSQLAQQLVADRMAESVVDGLEDRGRCIELQNLAIPFFATDRLLDAPVEQVTVGEASAS